jgi:hypothetical protein
MLFAHRHRIRLGLPVVVALSDAPKAEGAAPVFGVAFFEEGTIGHKPTAT